VFDGFGRYGFRVPCAMISPWARPLYVSHFVYDHISILKLVETKWNLPALTFRDANARPLLDMLDLRPRRSPPRRGWPRRCWTPTRARWRAT
jgi:phospholipase C